MTPTEHFQQKLLLFLIKLNKLKKDIKHFEDSKEISFRLNRLEI